MIDPVVASDGHSYDRQSIMNVLREPSLHMRRSPLTREALQQAVYSNRNLRKRITEHQQEMVTLARAAHAHGTARGHHEAAQAAAEDAAREAEKATEAERTAARPAAATQNGTQSCAGGKRRRSTTPESEGRGAGRKAARRRESSGGAAGSARLRGAAVGISGGGSGGGGGGGRSGQSVGRCSSTQCSLGAGHAGLCSHERVEGKRVRTQA